MDGTYFCVAGYCPIQSGDKGHFALLRGYAIRNIAVR